MLPDDNSENVVEKIAFIHFSKVAGRYIDSYLRQRVFKNNSNNLAEQQVKIFNSWAIPLALGRDWTEEELLQLAANRHSEQCPTPDEIRIHHSLWSHDYISRQYVHNHHCNWSTTTVQKFRENGWLTFMFIREPSELLCSLWTWIRSNAEKNPDALPLIKPEWLAVLSLDEFIKEILKDDNFSVFYGLPDYVDKVEYVSEYTEDNFKEFLLDHFDHNYQPERLGTKHRYASGNPGYAAYIEQGLISEDTQVLLNENKEVRRIRELLLTTC